jgi:chemotaxis-related protein WspB
VPTLSVIWRVSGMLLATGAESVVEILPPVACPPPPAAPDWIRGLFSYRTKLIPLVDAARLLGATPGPGRMFNRVLVLRVGAGGAPVDWPVGLWVEAVLGLERIDFGSDGGHPGFATEAGRFLGPVAPTRWGQVQLVKPVELFTPEQTSVLTERLAEAAA